VVIERGAIYWSDLGERTGSRPAKRRPVLVVSADTYNASRLATVIAVVISSNTSLATMPGNVFLPATASGLPKDSVVNVTAVVTLNKTDLDQCAGRAPLSLVRDIDRGLRTSLGL
jgi:mRNA interferase MazF